MTPPAHWGHWGLGCSLLSPSSSNSPPAAPQFLFFATKRHVEDKGLTKEPSSRHLSPGAVSLAAQDHPEQWRLLACAALHSSGQMWSGFLSAADDVPGADSENLEAAAGNGQKEEPKHQILLIVDADGRALRSQQAEPSVATGPAGGSTVCGGLPALGESLMLGCLLGGWNLGSGRGGPGEGWGSSWWQGP